MCSSLVLQPAATCCETFVLKNNTANLQRPSAASAPYLHLKKGRCTPLHYYCGQRMNSSPFLSNVSIDAPSVLSIIARDDEVALKQFCAEHFRLPSSESSRAFLSPILASAVSAGAIRCAGAALLHGADPDFCSTQDGRTSLLQVAAIQCSDAMVSHSDFRTPGCSFFCR
jgi:hypothetical protein